MKQPTIGKILCKLPSHNQLRWMQSQGLLQNRLQIGKISSRGSSQFLQATLLHRGMPGYVYQGEAESGGAQQVA